MATMFNSTAQLTLFALQKYLNHSDRNILSDQDSPIGNDLGRRNHDLHQRKMSVYRKKHQHKPGLQHASRYRHLRVALRVIHVFGGGRMMEMLAHFTIQIFELI